MATNGVKHALLEIGVEELPARFIQPALKQLDDLSRKNLSGSGLSFKDIQVFGTPRRLAVLIEGLAAKAVDRTDIVVGPPPKAAKSPDGKWTQAATGFAKKNHLSVGQLMLEQTTKGERYVAKIAHRGQKTEMILKDLFPHLIEQLNFPKSMIWNETGFRFARPIRWIVALYNSKVINFKLAGVKSDRTTMGLMALGSKKISIQKPDRYKSLLQSRCILVDSEARKKKILDQMDSISKKIKAKPVLDDLHLLEVVNLTEYPTSILGQFPESFLDLPREVLISVLRHHQKFFPLESAKKKLVNSFIGVRNGFSDSLDGIRDGYERVLNARLADAKFFFDNDCKVSLELLVNRLSEVGIHPELGHLLEKINRVRAIIRDSGTNMQLDPQTLQKADRAAYLSKADLLTQIVGEFPELQGIAGRFYGLHQGEDPEVANAIEQHYWPISAEGKLPKTECASIVSVADKMDSIVSNFYIGNIPTGSQDPYALRRQAIGVIRILIHNKWSLTISDLLEVTTQFPDVYKSELDTKTKEIKEFLKQRVSSWFVNQGYRVDEVEAVLAGLDQEPLSVLAEKLKAFKATRGRPEFVSLAAAIKRARNILKQAKSKGVLPPNQSNMDQASFQEPSEKDLYQALKGTEPKIEKSIHTKNYQEALLTLAPLKKPVDAFFDGVMVMVDDEKIRSQRLSLLMSIERLFGSVADFSKLQSASTTKN